LLDYINKNFNHEFKNKIINIVRKRLNNEYIDELEILFLMDEIKKYKWLSYALNILYFATNDIN
jgi:hypothetical protein